MGLKRKVRGGLVITFTIFIITKAPKYSVEVSVPPLDFITSVIAANTASISLCSDELGWKLFNNLEKS